MKVVKREVVLKESEKSVRSERDLRSPGPSLITDSRDSFWDSIDVKKLSPEQRKHFKRILEKEVFPKEHYDYIAEKIFERLRKEVKRS